jgi:DNA-binding GntR family transcriptional regulator
MRVPVQKYPPPLLRGGAPLMINSHSIADQTAKFIEDQIISGKLKPGEKIKELELAAHLKVSRFPIREAFKTLETKGLIYREPRRGIFVSRINEKDVWEIYTLKSALYSLGVALAMEKMTERWIKKLEKSVVAMEKIAEAPSPNVDRYQELNDLFHVSMIDIAEHGRLKSMAEALNNQIRRITFESFSSGAHLRTNSEYHRRIFEAIKAGDGAEAERLTREHIAIGLTRLRQMLQSKQINTR